MLMVCDYIYNAVCIVHVLNYITVHEESWS